MINEKTREILKVLNNITDSVVIRTPKITVSDEFKQIICSVDLEKLGENIEEPIGIAYLSQFLNVLNLFEEPDIQRDENTLIITEKESNFKKKIKYLTSNIDIIEEPDYKIIESTKKVNTILSFTLNQEILESIKKTSSVLKDFNAIHFKYKRGEGLDISLIVNETFNAAFNEFNINIPDSELDAQKDFEVKVPLESFLKIPELEYDLEVKYNEKKDAYRIYLNKSIFEVVMSTIV